MKAHGKWTGWLGKWQQLGAGALNEIGGGFIKEWTGKDPAEYMNPKDSIVVAGLTACIPGIIYGIDKYRQIQCMYADCLKTGVGEQGLPVFVCEDQKDYATCKYVVGEVFKAFPFTALFSHYINLIKDMLSNPFKIVGAGLAAGCSAMCAQPYEEPHSLCIGVKIASMIGESLRDVTSIIDQGAFKIKDDFCTRLTEQKSGAGNETQSKGLFGLFG